MIAHTINSLFTKNVIVFLYLKTDEREVKENNNSFLIITVHAW